MSNTKRYKKLDQVYTGKLITMLCEGSLTCWKSSQNKQLPAKCRKIKDFAEGIVAYRKFTVMISKGGDTMILKAKLYIRKIVLETGLAIGSSTAEIGGIDAMLLKIQDGIPYIPGSS